MKRQIQKYKTELNKFSGISVKIDAIVADASIKLDEKEKQIKAFKREKFLKVLENQDLKMQIDSLQEQVVNTIDSLLVEREMTRTINVKIDQMEELISTLNKRVGIGSILIGDNLASVSIRKNANEKRQITAIAKRTNEIDVLICLRIDWQKLESGISTLLSLPLMLLLLLVEMGEGQGFFNPEFKTNALCSKSISICEVDSNIPDFQLYP
ncbi:MAG: hypothetical protein PF450_12030 [Bacteroidales bacterium]|nr:hypothetical protein [Bacteroidales bacterium]